MSKRNNALNRGKFQKVLAWVKTQGEDAFKRSSRITLVEHAQACAEKLEFLVTATNISSARDEAYPELAKEKLAKKATRNTDASIDKSVVIGTQAIALAHLERKVENLQKTVEDLKKEYKDDIAILKRLTNILGPHA